MKTISVLLFVLSLAVPCGAAEVVPQVHTVTRVDDTTLTWYLHTPAGPRYPLVLILQGSQCENVYHHFDRAIERLTAGGVGVVCIEKRGMGPTTSGPTDEFLRRNTVYDRVLDILTVVAVLRRTQKAWDGRLVVVGGSEGGLVAEMAAPLVPETVAVVAIASGEGMPMRELLPLQMAAEMRQAGASPAAVDSHLAEVRKQMDAFRQNPTPWKQWGSDGKVAVNTWRWWDAILDVRALNALEQVDVPILIVQGADDVQCPPESARLIEERFAHLHKQNLTLRRYPGVKHDMTTPAGARAIDETLQWILQRLSSQPLLPGVISGFLHRLMQPLV